MTITYDKDCKGVFYTPNDIIANRAAWTAALRSGEYEQGRGRLHRNGAHCCLGVACEVLGVEGTLGASENPASIYVYGGSTGLPPYSVADALGFASPAGNTFDGDYLTTKNDQLLWTFNQIADHIDEDTLHMYGRIA